MNIEKFSGYDFDKHVIMVDLDIITMCNFKCWYCYARENNWNKTLNKEKLQHILNVLKDSNRYIDMSILGGEPLLNRHLKWFLNSLECIHHIKVATVFSNGTSVKQHVLKELLKDIPHKVNFNLSLHFHELHKKHAFLKFFKTAKLLNDFQKLWKITVMIDTKFLNEINKVDRIIKKYFPKTIIEFSYPVVDGKPIGTTAPVNVPRVETFQINDNKSKTYTYDEIYNLRLNKFKNYTCYTNYFHVYVDGRVVSCTYLDNIFSKTFSFNNYIQMACPFEYCVHDCMLETLKIKNENIIK